MAFAALVSLSRTINQILNDDRYPISLIGKQKLAWIYEQAISLQDFLQNFPKEANTVQRRIRDAANEAEDIIELFMYEQIRWYYKSIRAADAGITAIDSKRLFDFHELKRVTEEIGSIARQVVDINRRSALSDDSPTAISQPSTVFTPTGDNIAVSFQEHLKLDIMELLCGQLSKLQVVPIVGMGGIGKTTLARTISDDQLIVDHFDIRGWVTVSQNYSTQNILSNILDSVGVFNAESIESLKEDVFEMKQQIYQMLYGRRYLVVLDDVWSLDAWNDIRHIFPDNNNGSRIILTTRLCEVGSHVDSKRLYEMGFMSPDESWNLLQQKVFKHQNCPLEIEKIGREIARSCGGLPLAIVLIAGLLSNVSMTVASWKEIAENVQASLYKEAEQIEMIMSLSYTNLPHHLRSCFLYMGGFPEDYKIRVSKLVKLWVAEGFVRPDASKSLEESAEEYLEDLVKRSVVLVSSRKSDGKIKACSLHDLVRDLSTRKAHDENFKRRSSIAHSDLKSLAKTYASTVRSVICFDPSESSLGALRKFRLLRVLDVVDANVCSLPAQVFELFHLRFLAFGCPMKIPAAISMLRNLHTLIICPRKGSRRHSMYEVYLPLEIWNLPMLRHLVSFFHLLPSLSKTAFDPRNLQTLSISDFPSVPIQFPNLKKLEITVFGNTYYNLNKLGNFEFLHQLTLKLINISDFGTGDLYNHLVLPVSLKKLTLSGWRFPWEYMKTVGSLPSLQVLKLRDFGGKGNIWETTEGDFCCLKYLLIDRCDLKNWETQSSHFPRLEHLVLYRCPSLSEIPSNIGDIPTLELIEVDKANKSVVRSAKRIQEDQRALGNPELQVRCVRYRYQGF